MLSLDFTWTAPETCPTRADVVEQLSRAVDSGGKELPPLTARAVVSHEANQWRLELETEMDGRHGTRLLEADSCEGLARAATLVLALTLGEGLARRQAEDEARAAKPPAPSPPPPPPPPPLARRFVEPQRARSSNTLSWVTLGVAADPLGSLAPMATLGFGVESGIWRLALLADGTLPERSGVGDQGLTVRTFTFGGGVAACLAPLAPPLRLAACAEAGVTLLDARGGGTEDDRHVRVPLYGLGPRLSAQWPLSKRGFLSLDVGSRLFVKRPDLLVDGSTERRRVELGSASASLGAGVHW